MSQMDRLIGPSRRPGSQFREQFRENFNSGYDENFVRNQYQSERIRENRNPLRNDISYASGIG